MQIQLTIGIAATNAVRCAETEVSEGNSRVSKGLQQSPYLLVQVLQAVALKISRNELAEVLVVVFLGVLSHLLHVLGHLQPSSSAVRQGRLAAQGQASVLEGQEFRPVKNLKGNEGGGLVAIVPIASTHCHYPSSLR